MKRRNIGWIAVLIALLLLIMVLVMAVGSWAEARPWLEEMDLLPMWSQNG